MTETQIRGTWPKYKRIMKTEEGRGGEGRGGRGGEGREGGRKEGGREEGGVGGRGGMTAIHILMAPQYLYNNQVTYYVIT